MGLAAGPALVLTVVFTVANPPGASPPQIETLAQRVVGVIGMTRGTVSTVRLEYNAYRLVALVLYAAAAVLVLARLRGRWRVRPADALLLSAMLGTIAAILAPEGVDGAGGFLGMRLAVFSPVLLAAWVAACRPGRWGQIRPPRWGKVGLTHPNVLRATPDRRQAYDALSSSTTPHRLTQRADRARREGQPNNVDHGLTGTNRARPGLRESLAAQLATILRSTYWRIPPLR